MSFSQAFFRGLYQRSGSPERLPWHAPELPELFQRALSQAQGPLSVLDVGCGAGTFAIELARRGHRVTAIDFVPEAIQMARAEATKAGVEVEWVTADVLGFDAGGRRFEVVLDSGCLHCLSGRAVKRYRERLLSWLHPGGNYLLTHFEKRHALDWQPFGPRRLHHESVLRYFAPELRLHAYQSQFAPADPGRSRPLGRFWFKPVSPTPSGDRT